MYSRIYDVYEKRNINLEKKMQIDKYRFGNMATSLRLRSVE